MTQTRSGEPIGPERCVDVLRGITSPSRDEREGWSDAVGFWHDRGEIDLHESRVLSAVLGWAAVIETEIDNGRNQKWVRSSLLDALDFIAEAGNAPLDVLEAVSAAIPPPDRRIFELDFLEPIETEIDRLRAAQRHPPHTGDEPPRPPIGPEHAVLLVRGITSTWPVPRRQSAQAVADLCGAGRLDRREADALSGLLGWAAVVETEVPEVRGRLLDALSALSGAGLVETDTRTQLAAGLAPADLHPSERAAYDAIVTGLADGDVTEA